MMIGVSARPFSKIILQSTRTADRRIMSAVRGPNKRYKPTTRQPAAIPDQWDALCSDGVSEFDDGT